MFQQRRGVFTMVLVVVFVLAVASTFVFLRFSGKLAEYKINMFSSIGTDNLVFNESEQADEKEDAFSIGIIDNGAEEISNIDSGNDIPLIISAGKKYEEVAKSGDGITHLARRALREYLDGSSVNLNAEQKIFCEDYIQNRIGEKEIKIGESIAISEDLIAEAVNKSLGLSASELENLKNFTELVWDADF
ncbi:hypothetical protein KJ859_02105 [Patescibacteria group bacterium]|nr:hypothetical protein [Patescibacteria group bacterium]